MIETRQFVPFHRRMTRLAACSRAFHELCLHLRAEFASMYILVADSTGHIVKSELHGSNRTRRYGLVAIPTEDRYVGAGQREPRLLVFGQSEHRRPPPFIFQVVTFLAAI